MKISKRLAAVALALGLVTGGLTACSQPADVASKNLSLDADNFKILRRVVFINGITDNYLLSVTGYCSLGNDNTSTDLSITCKVDGGYKKHFLGRSDNVTYMIEQLDPADVSISHYKVEWRPSTIVPSIVIAK